MFSQARQLPGHALAELASLFVDVIKGGSLTNGKSLELFSTVLTALASSKENLAYGKGNPPINSFSAACTPFLWNQLLRLLLFQVN